MVFSGEKAILHFTEGRKCSCREFLLSRLPSRRHPGICRHSKVVTVCRSAAFRRGIPVTPAMFSRSPGPPPWRPSGPHVLRYLPGSTVYYLSHSISDTPIDLPDTLSCCPSYSTKPQLWIIPQSSFSDPHSVLLREMGENPWKHQLRPP